MRFFSPAKQSSRRSSRGSIPLQKPKSRRQEPPTLPQNPVDNKGVARLL